MQSLMLVAAGAAFNLVCSGTLTTRTMDGTNSEPYSSTYRMDLDRGIWCESRCEATHQFARILPTQLQLQAKNVDAPYEHSTLSNFIDRETGSQEIIATNREPGRPMMTIILKWKGQCEKAAFTGFPAFETKF